MERLVEYIHRRANAQVNLDFMAAVTGEEGMGKSHLAGRLGLLIDPGFNVDRFVYTLKQLTDHLYRLPPGSVIVCDEAILLALARRAMGADNVEVQQLTATIRSKNLVVLWLIPHIDDLDPYLRNRRIKMMLDVEARGRFTCYGQLRRAMSGTKPYRPKLFKASFPAMPADFAAGYEERKEKYSRAHNRKTDTDNWRPSPDEVDTLAARFRAITR